MRRLVFLALAAGCSNEIDPQDVTTADLRGRWIKRLDPAGSVQRVWSFREHGRFHPELDGARDVLAIYETSTLAQRPVFLATYRVEDGVIVQDTVWDEGFEVIGSTVRTKILGLTEGETLTLEAADGTPSTYQKIATCEIDVALPEGWRSYAVSQATVFDFPNSGPAYVAFADGEPTIGANGMLYRYDGECVPEFTREGAPGNVVVREDSGGGTHAVLGAHPTATIAGTVSYAHVVPGELVYDERPLPVDWRYFVDMVDIGGRAVMLFSQQGALTLVRDTGSDFAMTSVQPVPAGFAPTTLVASGGNVIIVGTNGNGTLHVVEENAGTFTASTVPTPGNAGTPAAAGRDGDLWIVWGAGATSPGSRLQQLYLSRRTAGAWTTEPFSIGAGPKVRYRDGRVHVLTGAEVDGRMHLMHTRIDGTTMTQEEVMPRTGLAPNVFDPAHGLPGDLAVAPDGSILTGYEGTTVLKRPGDVSAFGTADVTITISGSGRVTSTDGLVDCTQTCTVNAPVGRRLLLRATPAATFSCPPLQGNQAMCDVLVGGFYSNLTPGTFEHVMVGATFP